MPTLDGNHYFLTTLIPLRLDRLKRADGGFTAPSHLMREVLSTLPTAQQSPACVTAGFSSPFSRCTRTHFARAVVIDQPMYNGRDGGNALVESLRKVNLLAHQPVDSLSCPYLMFSADFDARPDEADGGFRSWATGLWSSGEVEMRAIFSNCLAFDQVVDAPTFCNWLERCRIETTMSFNDYYVPTADLHGYTLKGLLTAGGIGLLVLSALAAWALIALSLSLWWLLAAVPIALVAVLGALLAVLWIKGSRPFPAGANTDLRSVLKALYVQQRFVLLATRLQGVDAKSLYAGFGQFLKDVKPADVAGPTQPPGVIRSDGTPLVVHERIAQKPVTA